MGIERKYEANVRAVFTGAKADVRFFLIMSSGRLGVLGC